MDQLVVLQEIYESFSKGGDGLQEIDSKAIEGCCPELISKLLDGSKKSRIDEDVCRKLSLDLQDVYEIKRLGDICRRAALHGLAISTYNRALSLCRDQVLRPVLQNNLGQAYARQGDLARAAFYYQKSASSFSKAGDLTGFAHVLGNLGSAYRRNGDWEKAIEHCYRSLKTFEEKSDDLGIAQMTGSLGRIYADMGERELAARYFERSLTDFQKLGDKRSAAWVLDRMGRIASETQDRDKALGCYNQSLSLFEQQGQSQSQGVVLSNLGRMHLEMGETTAARESLEKAILLIGRNMQPNYLNTLSSLAATYNVTAKNCLKEAELSYEPGRGSSQSQRMEASRQFARASDRFLELASALPNILPEIKVAAGIARCRSYLAKLSGDVSDEEAVTLAEKAMASLDTAAANATNSKKTKIQSLQMTIAGLKEARSIKLLGSEPWRLIKAVTIAGENLMEGAGEFSSGDVNICLATGLGNFVASIEAERSRIDPSERLYAAASNFRSAGKHFLAAEKDRNERAARRLIEAAGILEGQASKECGHIQDEMRHSQLSFGPERDALLLIAEVMVDSLLEEIDDGSTIFTWDEALNLIPGPGKFLGAEKINIDELEAEPNPEPIAENDLPDLEISPERSVARGLILADGTLEASEGFVSEIVNPEEGWLVPVSASLPCKSYGRILPPIGQQFPGATSITMKPEMEIVGRDEDRIEGSIDKPVEEFGYRGRNIEPQETKLEGAGTEAREPPTGAGRRINRGSRRPLQPHESHTPPQSSYGPCSIAAGNRSNTIFHIGSAACLPRRDEEKTAGDRAGAAGGFFQALLSEGAVCYTRNCRCGDAIFSGFTRRPGYRTVCDLGCGTGILAVGAALLGAKAIGVEIDADALATARRNALKLGVDVDFIRADVNSVSLKGIDTVIMNPPFGAQKASSGDRAFLSKAQKIAKTIYSLHNQGSLDFVKSFVKPCIVQEVYRIPYPMKRCFEFHRQDIKIIEVELYRITCQ